MPAKAKNPSATNTVEVTVSIAQSYLDKFVQVTHACTKAGLRITQKMEVIGILIGTIDPAKIHALERVEGVAAVEGIRSYQIAPPSSKVQ